MMMKHTMLMPDLFPWGALAGDIIGSVYEQHPIKSIQFPLFDEQCRFTDDSVLTIATAEALLNAKIDFSATYRTWAIRYPRAGYGRLFRYWMNEGKAQPYDSFGNGSAMRVAPVAYGAKSEDEVLILAKQCSMVTHTHEEGIKGAQAVALAVFLARKKVEKQEIRNAIEHRFGYDLQRTLASIRPTYSFDVTCQKSVPESILCFLESTSCESAIRNAVSLGGDADTMACIAGSIAGAFYGVPLAIQNEVKERIPESMKKVITKFEAAVKETPA
jgi:ADP-ribosylglycohydrolase